MNERSAHLEKLKLLFESAPIGRYLGMSLGYCENGVARVRLPYRKDFEEGHGIIHGGLIGLLAGFPLVLVAVMLAIITGGLAAIALLALKLRERKQTLPFGIFLAIGAVITLVHGAGLWDWYLALF
jgi:hypothetical protein